MWLIRDALAGARGQLVDLDVVTLARQEGGIKATVSQAAGQIDAADRRARGSPVLGAMSRVPVLGEQIRAMRQMTGALQGIGETARHAGYRIQASFDRLEQGPPARVALLDEVLRQLDAIEVAVEEADVGTEPLLGPLAGTRADLARQLGHALDRLAEAEESVAAAHRLLVGPGRYLVLAGNNAEMRATPMPLAAGIVEMANGDIEASDFVQTSELALPNELRVMPPADLAELYGELWGLGREWRTTTTTPRFPVAASMLAEMSARSPLGPVDGVFLVDAVTLGAMADAVGGIEVDGELRTGEELVAQVLNENYLRFGEVDPVTRAARVDVQGELARQAFDELSEEAEAAIDLVAKLPRLAEGRHLMAWSPDPLVQSLFERLRAHGEIPAQPLMVAVQNASASKRDWYLDPKITIQGGRTVEGDALRLVISVTLDNPVVRPTTSVIQGTSRFVEPGEHRAFLTFYLPGTARAVQGIGHELAGIGRDGPAVVATAWMRVPEGEERTLSIEAEVPAEQAGAALVPSARVRPMTYHVNGVAVPDEAPRFVVWAPEPAVHVPLEERVAPIVALLALAALWTALWRARHRLEAQAPGWMAAVVRLR